MKKLLFFHQPDCPACAATRPVVQQFARAFGKDVEVLSVDIVEDDEDALPFAFPEMVPAFMLLEEGKKPRTFSGREITVGQLASWVLRG